MIKNLAFFKLKNLFWMKYWKFRSWKNPTGGTRYRHHISELNISKLHVLRWTQITRKCPKICYHFRSDKFPNPKCVAVDQFSFPIINYLLALSLVWMKNKQYHKKSHYIIHWETTLMNWKIHMKWYSEFRSMVLSDYINAYLFAIYSVHL